MVTGQAVVCELGDAAEVTLMVDVLLRHNVQAVMHFAGYKAVGESVVQPLKYYLNNLGSALGLLETMQMVGCHTLMCRIWLRAMWRRCSPFCAVAKASL